MDKYDEKADEIMIANGYVSSSMHKEIAAALRESAAQAYADMAARMWELNRLASPADHIALTESRATEMSIYAGESAYYRAKSAALRSIQGAEEGREKAK